jgi:hypothetical protein
VCDYAAAVHFQISGSPASTSPYRYYYTGLGGDHGDKPDGWSVYNGPLRVSRLTLVSPDHSGNDRNVASSWDPADNFGYWSDGTSNQLVIGEKHIPKRNIGHCISGRRPFDCNYYSVRTDDNGGGGRTFAVARAVQSANTTPADGAGWRPIPLIGDASAFNDGIRPGTTVELPDDDANSIVRQYAFGSAHPGVCNFLIGDGAVRTISASANADILVYLTAVNDGHSVTIP